MKNLLFPTILLLTASSWTAAAIPQKVPLNTYRSLWTNSPFTSKPIVDNTTVEVNPLDDYALIGVTPIDNGYRVTLINKKQPDQRTVVDTNSTKTGFTILGVDRKPGNPLGTVVRMKSGSKTGTVSFDDKLLTLVAAPVAPPIQQNRQGNNFVPGQQPQLQAGQQGQQGQQGRNGQQVRQPRPRVVPPPATTNGAVQQPQQQNQNTRQRRR